MTEGQWLSNGDPVAMLRFLYARKNADRRELLAWLAFRGRPVEPDPEPPSERKSRLFACACCWRIAELFLDERSVAAVEAAEHHADGRIGEWERQEAEATAREALTKVLAYPGLGTDPTGLLLREALPGTQSLQTAARAAVEAVGPTPEKTADTAYRAARYAMISSGDKTWAEALGAAALVSLIREVFGNPFRRPAVDPTWLAWNDGTVRRLAEAIYEERRFADLSILADALEEAGCADAEILDHLRGPGPHVPGCWALDLVLSKDR